MIAVVMINPIDFCAFTRSCCAFFHWKLCKREMVELQSSVSPLFE